MLKTGLLFDPKTPDHVKKMVGKILTPQAIMDAYRNARALYGTTDIVLWHSDQDPAIFGGTRKDYCTLNLQPRYGERALKFKIWKQSAQKVVMAPSDSDAMWLIIEGRNLDIPISCVLYAIPIEETAVASN
jgi:hypothetical protein